MLKGLNVVGCVDGKRSGCFTNRLRSGLARITEELWNVNFLRVFIDPQDVATQLSDLDSLIGFAEEHGMYTWITPNDYGGAFLPTPQMKEMMIDLATRYSGRSCVMYGLMNEPSPEMQFHKEKGNFDTPREVGFRRWMDIAQPMADAIREANPESIIVVPGSDNYGRDFTFYLQTPFSVEGRTKNIVYDAHRIASLDQAGSKTDPLFQARLKSQLDFIQQARYPLIFGEFNGVLGENNILPMSRIDTDYMRGVIEIVNQHPGQVHYNVWALDPWGNSGLFLPPDFTRLSPRGELILADLQQHPPTNFRG